MTRLVVTGAAGYIGRNVASRLGDREDVHLVPHRWRDRESLEDALGAGGIDRCIHLGWYANRADYLWASEPNLRSLQAATELVTALLERGCRHLVVAGTSAEYGAPDGTVDEESPVNPVTMYAACKDALRTLVQSTWLNGRMTVAWGRIFNVAGPGEDAGRIVPTVTRSLLDGVPVSLSDGMQERDFLHVADVAGALLALSDSGHSGVFNISSGAGVQLRQLFTQIADRAGRPRRLLRFGDRPRREDDPARLVGSNAKLRMATGWSPAHDLATMVDDVIAYWSAQPDTVSAAAPRG